MQYWGMTLSILQSFMRFLKAKDIRSCLKYYRKQILMGTKFFIISFISLVLSSVSSISFPESSFPLTRGRKTRALGATILNNKGNNRILPIQFHCAICIYGACLEWLPPELSFSDRWSRETKTLGTRSVFHMYSNSKSVFVIWCC